VKGGCYLSAVAKIESISELTVSVGQNLFVERPTSSTLSAFSSEDVSNTSRRSLEPPLQVQNSKLKMTGNAVF